MKKIFVLLMILLLALTACNGANNSNTEPTAVETVAQVQPTATTPSVAPTEIPTSSADAGSVPATDVATPTPVAPGCYPDSISSLIDLTANENIAPVSAAEWQKGGDASAPITVVEYGDFQ